MSFNQEASFDEGKDMAIKAPVGKSNIGRTCTEPMDGGNSDDDHQFLSVRSKGPGKQIQIFSNDNGPNFNVQQHERDVWSTGMPNPFGAQNKFQEPNTIVNTSLLGEGSNSGTYKTKAPCPPIKFSSTNGIKTLQPRQDKNPYSEYPLPLKKRGHFESVPYSRKTSHDEKIKNDMRNLKTRPDDQNDIAYPLEELHQLMEPILRYAVQKGTYISINNQLHRITATPVLSPDTSREEILCGIIDRPPPEVQGLPLLLTPSVSTHQYYNHEDNEREIGFPEVEECEVIEAERSQEPSDAEMPDEPLDLSYKPLQGNDLPDTANTDETVGSLEDVGGSQTLSMAFKEKAMESVNTGEENEEEEPSQSHERSTDNFFRIIQALHQLQTQRALERKAEIEATKVDKATIAHQQVEEKPGNCSTEERTSLPDLNSLDLTDGDGCVKETARERINEKLKQKIKKK